MKLTYLFEEALEIAPPWEVIGLMKVLNDAVDKVYRQEEQETLEKTRYFWLTNRQTCLTDRVRAWKVFCR